MKFRTTEKDIKDNYKTIIEIEGQKLQSTLNHFSPIAYTCNTEGWRADINHLCM